MPLRNSGTRARPEPRVPAHRRTRPRLLRTRPARTRPPDRGSLHPRPAPRPCVQGLRLHRDPRRRLPDQPAPDPPTRGTSRTMGGGGRPVGGSRRARPCTGRSAHPYPHPAHTTASTRRHAAGRTTIRTGRRPGLIQREIISSCAKGKDRTNLRHLRRTPPETQPQTLR